VQQRKLPWTVSINFPDGTHKDRLILARNLWEVEEQIKADRINANTVSISRYMNPANPERFYQ
jgi:hypothetical protein